MIKERCRISEPSNSSDPFRETNRNSPTTGLQDEMVDLGKIGRCSREELLVSGGCRLFVGGSGKKQTEGKISHIQHCWERSDEFESLP